MGSMSQILYRVGNHFLGPSHGDFGAHFSISSDDFGLHEMLLVPVSGWARTLYRHICLTYEAFCHAPTLPKRYDFILFYMILYVFIKFNKTFFVRF